MFKITYEQHEAAFHAGQAMAWRDGTSHSKWSNVFYREARIATHQEYAADYASDARRKMGLVDADQFYA